MTRVCLVSASHHRNDTRLVERQARSLQSNGFDVTVLLNDGLGEEIKNGIKIVNPSSFWKNRLKIIFFAKKLFLAKAREIDADIYQMQSPECWLLGIELQKNGKKVIYDAEEDLPRHIKEKEWLPFFIRTLVSFFVEKFMLKILAKYDGLISPHLHVIDYLKKINKNVYYVVNFPHLNNFNDFSFSQYNSRSNLMCYTGTVYYYSNQFVILDAIKNIADVKYEIAGHIDHGYLEQLSLHDSFPKFVFHGRLPWDQLKYFYSKFKIGIVVYDYKLNLGWKQGSFGTNKIFEYMESALPFICTDFDLWKAIIDEYDCGICVQPGNEFQIANAINFLLTNPERAYQMGQNGRKAVIEKFNWQSQENVYLDLFHNLNHK
jgi:glycosyltransferase involved in cell wall biosynthesis